MLAKRSYGVCFSIYIAMATRALHGKKFSTQVKA